MRSMLSGPCFARRFVAGMLSASLALATLVCLSPLSAAQEVRQATVGVQDEEPAAADALLIQPAQLRPLTEDKAAQESGALRILDLRSSDAYGAGHIPGAAFANFSDLAAVAKADNGMHDKDAWAKAISPLGITRDTHVIVYGERNVTNTTRAWWLLKYLGVKNVTVLDGGWDAWEAGGNPTSTEKSTYDASDFAPEFQAERVVEKDELKDLLDKSGVTVLDTRSAGEFTGDQARGGRGGRIPGATHLEWTEMVNDEGRFKSKAELQKLFQEHGALPEEVCVTYCQSGGRASVEAFALELLGYPKVRVYYASWQEWGKAEDVPVEKGVAKDGDGQQTDR